MFSPILFWMVLLGRKSIEGLHGPPRPHTEHPLNTPVTPPTEGVSHRDALCMRPRSTGYSNSKHPRNFLAELRGNALARDPAILKSSVPRVT